MKKSTYFTEYFLLTKIFHGVTSLLCFSPAGSGWRVTCFFTAVKLRRITQWARPHYVAIQLWPTGHIFDIPALVWDATLAEIPCTEMTLRLFNNSPRRSFQSSQTIRLKSPTDSSCRRLYVHSAAFINDLYPLLHQTLSLRTAFSQ